MPSRPKKQELVDQLIGILLAEQKALERSVQNAAEGATHPEAKPENKYDTRGLEASYLAGAQKERLQELHGNILLLQSLELRDFGEETPIGVTALVLLEQEEENKLCLLLTVGGGYPLLTDGKPVIIITPQSPLGKALLGKKTGDSFELKTSQGVRSCEILQVL